MMNSRTTRPVLLYFVVTFALTLPFYILGALTSMQLIPGVPISGLGVICPAAAASIVSYRRGGRRALTSFLRGSFDLRRIKAKLWLLPAFLLMPAVMLLSYVVMNMMGSTLPLPQASAANVLGLFVATFAAAVCEELGWSGCATEPLQRRFGALGAALLIGFVWALWHFFPLIEVHRSLSYILWWTLGTVAIRIIIVWLFNNTGRSVVVAALFHAMINVAWQLFPIDGSFYDPGVTSPILAVTAALIVVGWGPATLTRAPLRSTRAPRQIP